MLVGWSVCRFLHKFQKSFETFAGQLYSLMKTVSTKAAHETTTQSSVQYIWQVLPSHKIFLMQDAFLLIFQLLSFISRNNKFNIWVLQHLNNMHKVKLLLQVKKLQWLQNQQKHILQQKNVVAGKNLPYTAAPDTAPEEARLPVSPKNNADGMNWFMNPMKRIVPQNFPGRSIFLLAGPCLAQNTLLV